MVVTGDTPVGKVVAAPPSDESVSATAVPVPAGAGRPEAGTLRSWAALRPGTGARP